MFKYTPANEVAEVGLYCCSKQYSCSKLLLIDVIFILFSDKMLFTLTHSLEHLRMTSGTAKNKTLEQTRFLRMNYVARQSLMLMVMVADGTLELDYANVIIVDPGVQIDEI